MDFLNKLYESNYFGIGLFAVISFLVITFLIVLFFGKKDEKKRKLEETNKNLDINAVNTFADTSTSSKVEVPTPVAPVEPVMPEPINQVEEPSSIPSFTKVDEIPTIASVEPLDPVAPLEPVAPVEIEPVPETPVISPIPSPIEEANIPVNNEPTPTVIAPTIINPEPSSVTLEPVTITPEPEEIKTPVIQEETPSLVIPEEPIIEEPTISETYYQPVETPKAEEISVPSIDFDAIARSISKELDELEKNNEASKVTPIDEIVSTPKKEENDISSIYVNNGVNKPSRAPIDLPKKIDLPTKKNI